MNRYERKRRYMGPWRNVHSGIWLIGLAILFLTGMWWPGILVLVGLSMVLEWVFSEARSAESQPAGQPIPQPQAAPRSAGQTVTQTPAAPVTPAPSPTAPAAPISFTQAARFHPFGELPSACPRCGGPVRAQEVKWTGSRSAICAYCGSNLPMKKG